MENTTQPIEPQKTDRQLLEEIHDNSRKTKNYMKWSLIITVAFVVIPLIATMILIPIALKSITSVFSSYGLDSLSGTSVEGGSGSTVQDLINQYTK